MGLEHYYQHHHHIFVLCIARICYLALAQRHRGPYVLTNFVDDARRPLIPRYLVHI
jgi:hypothetical protein